jgi:hypothetical protein
VKNEKMKGKEGKGKRKRIKEGKKRGEGKKREEEKGGSRGRILP